MKNMNKEPMIERQKIIKKEIKMIKDFLKKSFTDGSIEMTETELCELISKSLSFGIGTAKVRIRQLKKDNFLNVIRKTRMDGYGKVALPALFEINIGKTNKKNTNTTKFTTLEKAVQPLIDFLDKNYDPMTTVIISKDRVDVLRKDMGMPLEIKD
jgi:hypothetical protein